MLSLAKGVSCRDVSYCEEKFATLKRGGTNALHIVSDFDLTLTKGKAPGKASNTVNSQIREGNYLGEGYRRDSLELRKKYYPIEMDLSLPLEEKKRHMLEWTQSIHDQLRKHGFSRRIVSRIGRERPFVLREGVPALFSWSECNRVPLIIFSAALGNLIEAALCESGLLHSEVRIISNFAEFDESGMMSGVKEPVVSMFNKTEALLRGTAYEQVIEGRPNVLLLGDSLGDIEMATGERHETVLSVGFLNGRASHKERFLGAFDMVIEEDSDLSVVINLLQGVACAK